MLNNENAINYISNLMKSSANNDLIADEAILDITWIKDTNVGVTSLEGIKHNETNEFYLINCSSNKLNVK